MFNHNGHDRMHNGHYFFVVSIVKPIVSIVVKPRFHLVGKKSALEGNGRFMLA